MFQRINTNSVNMTENQKRLLFWMGYDLYASAKYPKLHSYEYYRDIEMLQSDEAWSDVLIALRKVRDNEVGDLTGVFENLKADSSTIRSYLMKVLDVLENGMNGEPPQTQ